MPIGRDVETWYILITKLIAQFTDYRGKRITKSVLIAYRLSNKVRLNVFINIADNRNDELCIATLSH